MWKGKVESGAWFFEGSHHEYTEQNREYQRESGVFLGHELVGYARNSEDGNESRGDVEHHFFENGYGFGRFFNELFLLGVFHPMSLLTAYDGVQAWRLYHLQNLFQHRIDDLVSLHRLFNERHLFQCFEKRVKVRITLKVPFRVEKIL